jgi:hypothetical protein
MNEEGVCSACQFSGYKKTEIGLAVREEQLKILCDKHCKGDGSYDVIVSCSGGKDGSFVAHKLKYKYGMNPLTVAWAPLLPTDIGRKNLDVFIDFGFDNIIGKPNGVVTGKLTNLSLKHMGDAFQPFIYGQTNVPLKIAVQHNASLIMHGKNGEVEYGGNMKNAHLQGVAVNSSVYFFHSYMAIPDFDDENISNCNYSRQKICAAVQKRNVMGCQFHPGKTGKIG